MVVKRKPKSVDEFIQEGGSAPQIEAPKPVAESGKEEQGVKLRVPLDLLNQIDSAVKNRRPAPSRHQWILEAIYEKLERESSE